jgi:capsule polysaccharide export protein KpsE/RkpR
MVHIHVATLQGHNVCETQAGSSLQVDALEEAVRVAKSRERDTAAELARVQQKLLEAEEARIREAHHAQTMSREANAEKAHAAAMAERLEGAQCRIEALERQVRLARIDLDSGPPSATGPFCRTTTPRCALQKWRMHSS